jgi:SIR2-like domain
MKKVVFVGNGINNIYETNPHSWENILSKIAGISEKDITITKKKPFPLLYEEIYLKILKAKGTKESALKEKIAILVQQIEPNKIHQELIDLNFDNYITTNYDYSLEKVLLQVKSIDEIKNNGIVNESKYSVFRHNITEGKRFWHVHGEINYPNTITLGYEHYGGQLQQFRNYVVSGTNYKSFNFNKFPLHKQLKENMVSENHSWINFLFTHEVHIIGLSLDYIETDLWYLLTNRARFQLEHSDLIKNKIIYYCPDKYKNINIFKKQLMDANDIRTKYLPGKKIEYYNNVVNELKNLK